MCLCQKYVHPRSVYRHVLNPVSVSTGCGKCDECREIQRNEWVNRLCFEYDSNKGGCCVFLTFTYNDAHLPVFTDGDFTCKCFNHDDVKVFIKTLKNYYWRKFHSCPFRYFFASEYGKHTQRPHYHCLFFLDASLASHWSDFCEVCRHIWSKSILPPADDLFSVRSMDLGFMYPKIDKGRYVDDLGNDKTPLIKSGVKGMVYCSKYACKDMSFYSEDIAAYLASENGYKLKPFLPRHWQSNKLGYSAVGVSLKAPEKSFNIGIVNPLSKEVCPLPNYVINKLLYKNVFVGRTKVDDKTGKVVKLYDRDLSDFGRNYLYTSFMARVVRHARKMSVTMQSLDFDLGIDFDVSYFRDIAARCNFGDYKDYRNFIPAAIYHCFWRNYDKVAFCYALERCDGDLSAMLSDGDFLRDLVVSSKDTAAKRISDDFVQVEPIYADDVFGYISRFDKLYSNLCRLLSCKTVSSRVRKREEGYELREKLTHTFDKKLC